MDTEKGTAASSDGGGGGSARAGVQLPRIDAAKAIGIVEAEQNLIRTDYATGAGCESPGHCAIGALLFAGGMTNGELHVLDEPQAWRSHDTATRILADQYGLHRRHACEIITENDLVNEGVVERRLAVFRAHP